MIATSRTFSGVIDVELGHLSNGQLDAALRKIDERVDAWLNGHGAVPGVPTITAHVQMQERDNGQVVVFKTVNVVSNPQESPQ